MSSRCATAAGRHEPANTSGARHGLAEARHKLDASVEKDELHQRLVGVDLAVLLCGRCDSEPIGTAC